jgi:hypothetical protein
VEQEDASERHRDTLPIVVSRGLPRRNNREERLRPHARRRGEPDRGLCDPRRRDAPRGLAVRQVSPVPVLTVCFSAVAALASFELDLMPWGTIAFLRLAAALGAASGGVFALVARLAPPTTVGSATGVVGAAGGLAGNGRPARRRLERPSSGAPTAKADGNREIWGVRPLSRGVCMSAPLSPVASCPR